MFESLCHWGWAEELTEFLGFKNVQREVATDKEGISLKTVSVIESHFSLPRVCTGGFWSKKLDYTQNVYLQN